MDGEKKITSAMDPQKRKVIVILIVTGAVLLVCALTVGLLELFGDGLSGGADRTVGTVDPSRLEDTKEADFDIMEYEEYLKLDRNIYLSENGVQFSVEDEDANAHGEAFEVMYNVIRAINEGDHLAYNELMGDSKLEEKSFTQQQIYDIVIQVYSKTAMTGKNNLEYVEYVYKVKYRIHENNGTYRNDIVSDVARPQYFVVNDSTGEFLVMDIIYSGN